MYNQLGNFPDNSCNKKVTVTKSSIEKINFKSYLLRSSDCEINDLP